MKAWNPISVCVFPGPFAWHATAAGVLVALAPAPAASTAADRMSAGTPPDTARDRTRTATDDDRRLSGEQRQERTTEGEYGGIGGLGDDDARSAYVEEARLSRIAGLARGRDDSREDGPVAGPSSVYESVSTEVAVPIASSSSPSTIVATSSAADRLSQHLEDAPLEHPPSSARMRRVPRLSPNSRLERPAPAALPSSDFFTAGRPARPLQRRSSLPSAPTRRHRASSDGPSSRTEWSAADRSQGRLDPDEHWLSEDEADDYVQRMTPRARVAPPGRRGPSSGNRRDEPAVPKAMGRSVDLGAPLHSIHQHPAKQPLPSSPPPDTSASTFASVIPALLPSLTCTCRRLFHDPATLPCGHSRCIACDPTPASPIPLPTATASGLSTAAASPQPSPPFDAGPTSSFFSHHMPMLGSFRHHRSPSHTSLLSEQSTPSLPSSHRPSIDLPKFTCLHPHCSADTSATGVPPFLPRVDFTLRKVVELVRRAVPDVDAFVAGRTIRPPFSRAESSLESLFQDARISPSVSDAGKAAGPSRLAPPAPGTFPRTGSGESGSSGSSGGGEDETLMEDELKRGRQSKSGWKTSKKSRVAEPVPTGLPSPFPPPLTLDLSHVPPTFLADLQADCECQVCVQLLHDPVTTACGHSFCRDCLARAYDHSDKCPLCRADLPSLAFFRTQRTNTALQAVLSVALPSIVADRAAAMREEEQAQLASVPIFVCTTAWPTIKTYLHIFEPRYRLMIRRALESPSQSFGMVLPLKTATGADVVNEYGTMLRITSCNVLEDGRMILETLGTHRFRTVERGILDGYTVGRVERVDDVSPEQEATLEAAALARNDRDPSDNEADYADPNSAASRPPMTGNVELSIDQLMQICLDFIRTLRASSAPWVIERLNRTVGETPANPHDFSWYAAEVFPVEDHVKVTLLQITSVRERLRLIVFWIEQFRSSWWYTRGCTIC
ncbi:hypothetical protein JCM8097_009091 [Rhodosporidiobolus ruineniae]